MLIMEMVLCSLALIRKTHCVECQQFLTLITHWQCPFASLHGLRPTPESRGSTLLEEEEVFPSERTHQDYPLHPLKWEQLI